MKYIGNAFSLQMVPTDCVIKVSSATRAEALNPGNVSIVGHPDTAAVLGVAPNRASIKLVPGDVLYVAQLRGGRLPEGGDEAAGGILVRLREGGAGGRLTGAGRIYY